MNENRRDTRSGAYSRGGIALGRRGFLHGLAALGAAAGVAYFFKTGEAFAAVPPLDRSGIPDFLDTDLANVDFKYSVCLQCHSTCGIKVKVSKGSTPTVLKIDGNPFHPCCADDDERLVQGALPIDDLDVRKAKGTLCPKGQAGIEIIYNPYRIPTPLKRVGARGSGKWQAITYQQAIQEIAEKIAPYWTRGPEPGYSPQTSDYIDPSNTSIGFKNNQVALYIGRLEHGQKEFTDRWFQKGFGSVNYRLDHTSICETSHHVGLDLVLDGKKNHTKPDFLNAQFVLLVGTNILEANFPQQALSRKVARAIKQNGLKIAVADPRFSKVAAKATANGGYWLPVIPGTDAAMCFAIMRSWLDGSPNLESDSGNQVDTRFLRNATQGQATADGEYSVCDATLLIRRDDGKYYRDGGGNHYVWDGTQGVAVGSSPNTNTATPAHGQLMTGASGVVVDGVTCDSVFQLLVDEVMSRGVSEWSAISGLPTGTVKAVADEMAAAGKKASAEFYRGGVQHTNGTYNALAIAALNTLRGNIDHKGGLAANGGGHWHEMDGAGKPGTTNLMSVSGGYAPKGPRVDRAGAKWEDYKGSEAAPLRPWFPFAKYGNWQEVIPSLAQGYPYPIAALFMYWADPLYTTPAARDVCSTILRDESKLPLLVVFDNDFGATASLADYIIPDTTYLERYSTPHTSPAVLSKVSGFRQPVVGSYASPPNYDNFQAAVGDCWQYEDFWIGMAKRLEAITGRSFPGIGTNGIAPGVPLNCAKDWYDGILQNFSAEAGVSVQSILEHGGLFEAPGNEYSGDKQKHAFGFAAVIRLYIEKLATTADTFVDPTGATKFFPLPKYEPIKDVLDQPIDDDPYGYPFISVTYKPIQHKMAVTAVCPTLMAIQPENFIEMNSGDARALGLETGDAVRVTSATNASGVVGKVMATECVRPGVIATSMGFGHWETSSRSQTIDGKATGFDPRRGRGVNTNAVQRLDPVLGDVSLQDKIGGSCAYSNTRVRVTKVSV